MARPVQKNDLPEQLRIRHAVYGMPFMGGSGIQLPNVGEITWDSVALALERM